MKYKGVYYQKRWYFCPPPLHFSSDIFFPKYIENFLFSPVFPPHTPYIRVFSITNNPYFCLPPPGAGGRGQNKIYTVIHPCWNILGIFSFPHQVEISLIVWSLVLILAGEWFMNWLIYWFIEWVIYELRDFLIEWFMNWGIYWLNNLLFD